MFKSNSISLRHIMKLPVDMRANFLMKHYPRLNVDLVHSLLNGHCNLR